MDNEPGSVPGDRLPGAPGKSRTDCCALFAGTGLRKAAAALLKNESDTRQACAAECRLAIHAKKTRQNKYENPVLIQSEPIGLVMRGSPEITRCRHTRQVSPLNGARSHTYRRQVLLTAKPATKPKTTPFKPVSPELQWPARDISSAPAARPQIARVAAPDSGGKRCRLPHAGRTQQTQPGHIVRPRSILPDRSKLSCIFPDETHHAIGRLSTP